MSPRASLEQAGLRVAARAPGRMVLAKPGGALFAGRNYRIFRSDDCGREWSALARIPTAAWRRAAPLSRLACRALRQEVRALAHLSDGSLVASNREGVYFGRAGEALLRPAQLEAGDTPFRPPMRLGVGPGDVVVFGEYGSSRPRHDVRLFASRDRGESFEIVHTFAGGSVGHVHNVVYDAAGDFYWVLIGDHGDHPGIGRLSSDLRHFEWYLRGEQRYRVVEIFDEGDHLLYATDTEVETNALIRLHKENGKSERVREFGGSCIYACRFGGIYAITTTVEPSPVNRDPHSELWLSRDGEQWSRALRLRKDRWNAKLFQFGSLVLPSGGADDETILVSGQAVQGLDGQTVAARWAGRSDSDGASAGEGAP